MFDIWPYKFKNESTDFLKLDGNYFTGINDLNLSSIPSSSCHDALVQACLLEYVRNELLITGSFAD